MNAIIEYNPDFSKLVCPTCEKVFSKPIHAEDQVTQLACDHLVHIGCHRQFESDGCIGCRKAKPYSVLFGEEIQNAIISIFSPTDLSPTEDLKRRGIIFKLVALLRRSDRNEEENTKEELIKSIIQIIKTDADANSQLECNLEDLTIIKTLIAVQNLFYLKQTYDFHQIYYFMERFIREVFEQGDDVAAKLDQRYVQRIWLQFHTLKLSDNDLRRMRSEADYPKVTHAIKKGKVKPDEAQLLLSKLSGPIIRNIVTPEDYENNLENNQQGVMHRLLLAYTVLPMIIGHTLKNWYEDREDDTFYGSVILGLLGVTTFALVQCFQKIRENEDLKWLQSEVEPARRECLKTLKTIK